ncbi:MAG: hypothetical protein RLZZ131_727, partial [Actinomycetota bacterium]
YLERGPNAPKRTKGERRNEEKSA